MRRSRFSPLMAVAAGAWLIAAIYLLVVHAVMDQEHLWAPYLAVVIYLPFWLVALWAGVLLVRGAGRTGQAAWSLVASTLAGLASYVFLTSLDSGPSINPEGYGAILLTVLSIGAFLGTLRPKRAVDAT